MYLSKLLLNPRCREARRDASLPYEFHRTLAKAFLTNSGTDYRAQHQVLFRLEPINYASALPTILVQSASIPNWHELPEAYLLEKPETKLLAPNFSIGQSLAFRLVANPTKKERRPGQRQGRRVALLDYTETSEQTPACAWLESKGRQHGFKVLYATTNAFWSVLDKTEHNKSKNNLPFYGVRYDGLLQITDKEPFAKAIQSGIGPAKAFGFGLLSVALPNVFLG